MYVAAGSALVVAILLAVGDAPPVPGGCSAPAKEHQNQPGCFLSAELNIESAPKQIYWHIYQATDFNAAVSETRRHQWSTVVRAHDRIWLYVLGDEATKAGVGIHTATIGPLALPAGRPVTIRFLESLFPPGMQTRVHSHPGAEAFYVVAGEQCMETPTERMKIPAGKTFIVAGGPHVQTAPQGRRNLVALVVPPNEPWMSLDVSWQPSDFCAH